MDRASERQQILESILRTTRWPTKLNVAAAETEAVQQFAVPATSTAQDMVEDEPNVAVRIQRQSMKFLHA